jgi:hypothetical protein
VVPQPTYCLISFLWFSSNPTPLISSGSTGTLQSDLSSIVKQPTYSLISLQQTFSDSEVEM